MNEIKIKLYLYKNIREKLAEIPADYISSDIPFNFMDVDEFELTIPKYKNDKKEESRLYKIIKSRQMVEMILEDKTGNRRIERFTLTNAKGQGDKKVFTCYSNEWKLKNTKITFPQMSRQLVNIPEDTVNVGEGIMNTVCQQIGYSIGYVDPKARTKVCKCVKYYNVNLYENFELNKVEENGLIFSKDVHINVKSNAPIYVSFLHNYAKNINPNDGKVITELNYKHDFTSSPAYDTIKNIKCYQLSEEGNRFGIKYVLTLADGNTIEYKDEYINCTNKGLKVDSIVLQYDYGEIEEIENIVYCSTEEQETNAYKYLTEVISPLYNVYFEFDNVNMLINIYSVDSLNEESMFNLNSKIIKQLHTKEDESIPTILSVESENDVNINDMTLNGTNQIEDYTYYIENEIMSDELSEALMKYNELAQQNFEQWNNLNDQKIEIQNKYNKAESKVTTYTYKIKYTYNLLSSFFGKEDDYSKQQQSNLKQEIEGYESIVARLMQEMTGYTAEITEINNEIAYLNSQMLKQNTIDENGNKLFTQEDLDELESYKEVITLQDSNFTTSYSLYNYAVEYMQNKVKPNIDFTINTVDLVSVFDNPDKLDNLKPGILFNLDRNYKDDGLFSERQFRLKKINYRVNKGKGTISMASCVFANKVIDLGKVNNSGSLGRTTNKVKSLMSNFSDVWEESKTSNNFVGEMIKNGLNIFSTNIKGNTYKNKIDISERGVFVIDVSNTSGNTSEDNQIALTGGMLCITNDCWQSCSTAICSDGIIAKTLIGNIILGNKLCINDEYGTFYIGNDPDEETKDFGMYIFDSLGNNNESRMKRIFLGLYETEGVRKAALRLYSKNGRELCISEDGIVNTVILPVDGNISNGYPLRTYLPLHDGIFQIRECKIKIAIEPYRACSRSAEASLNGNTSVSADSVTSSSETPPVTVDGGGNSSYSITTPQISVFTGRDGDILDENGNVHGHNHTMYHQHSFSVNLYHTHTISGGLHSHSVPGHSHSMNLSHGHNLEFGVYTGTQAPSISIRIGDRIYSASNGDVIDLTQALNTERDVPVSGINFKEISFESNINTRIYGTLFLKTFDGF